MGHYGVVLAGLARPIGGRAWERARNRTASQEHRIARMKANIDSDRERTTIEKSATADSHRENGKSGQPAEKSTAIDSEGAGEYVVVADRHRESHKTSTSDQSWQSVLVQQRHNVNMKKDDRCKSNMQLTTIRRKQQTPTSLF